METATEGDSPAAGEHTETYALHNSELQRTTMVLRSAEKQAAFLLPHLRAGMSLLDCGSGPGTITTGLAQRVAPGHVTGIDISAGEVERATLHAAQAGITNIDFREGNVYALPFADESFDAVYTNALLDHLSDPVGALREMYRVLKRGGVIGARIADRDGYLIYPADKVILNDLNDDLAEDSPQPVRKRIGKEIRRLLREAGFVRTQASASYDTYGTPELVHNISSAMVSLNLRAKDGSAADAELDALAAAWRALGASPDAFVAQCLCEGLGWRE